MTDAQFNGIQLLIFILWCFTMTRLGRIADRLDEIDREATKIRKKLEEK